MSSPEPIHPDGEARPGPLTTATREVLDWLFTIPAPPPEVERAARLLFLDTLGCAIGGGAKPELQALASSLATVEAGPLRLPGMTHGLTAPAAAYWSAMAATWDEACEGLAVAHGRPGLHAFPPALALTLAWGGTLGDALSALIRGFEIGGRLGARLRIGPGRHVDGTWGTFGAVAAAGSALGHGPDLAMGAIEAAACQTPTSLYLPVAQGATARNTYVAESVRRAISLALSVEAGVTTPGGALETVEELAFAPDGGRPPLAPRGEWLITRGYLKPYAAVRHVHYGAEAARQWRRHDRRTDAIEALRLDVYPEAVTYCGNRAPTTPIKAQFSLTYGIARMLVAGDLGPDAYTIEALTDPETRRLEALIEVRPIPGTSPDQRYATLHITAPPTAAPPATTPPATIPPPTAPPATEVIRVDRVVGDAGNPMGVDEVVAKFTAYSHWWQGDGWSAAEVAAAVLEAPAGTPLAEVLAGR